MIVTSHLRPPIPLRQFDWVAYLEGRKEETRFYGYGRTEEEAVAELEEMLREWEQERSTRNDFVLDSLLPQV